MAKTLNPDRVHEALAKVLEAKHGCKISITVKNTDGSAIFHPIRRIYP